MERFANIQHFSKYQDTYLSDWIRERMRFHPEPQRKGRKRGDQIGHSWIKQLSCYMSGTINFSHKEKAKQLKQSYSTVRIWETENFYKELSENACDKFAREWVSYVNNMRKDDNPPSEKICKKKFADTAQYSDCVITKIIDQFFPTFEFDSQMPRYKPQVLITALQLDNFTKDRRQVIERNITKEFLKRAIEFYTRDNFINLNHLMREEATESSDRLKEILTAVREHLQE